MKPLKTLYLEIELGDANWIDLFIQNRLSIEILAGVIVFILAVVIRRKQKQFKQSLRLLKINGVQVPICDRPLEMAIRHLFPIGTKINGSVIASYSTSREYLDYYGFSKGGEVNGVNMESGVTLNWEDLNSYSGQNLDRLTEELNQIENDLLNSYL